MKTEGFASAVEHGRDSSLATEWRSTEFVPAGSTANGLDTALMHIAQECGVSVVLALWHCEGTEAQVVSACHRPSTPAYELAACREHATEAALNVKKEGFGTAQWQLFRSSSYSTGLIALKGGIVTLSVGPQTTGPGEAEKRWSKFETFLPLVAACLEQWLATQHALDDARCYFHAFEKCGTATILLGDNGEILHANCTAEALLAEMDGLFRLNQRLVCASLADTLLLQAALSHFHLEALEGMATTPVLAVSRVNRRPLTLALAAIGSEPRAFDEKVHAIAYVFDPEQRVSELVNPVCQLYGLSKSETKLACALVEGESLSAAAQRLRLQEQTVRTYLKHIFEKTDTHRQAELVHLMLESAVRLAPGLNVQAFTQTVMHNNKAPSNAGPR